MNKKIYWTGHILSGSPTLFSAFQRDLGVTPAKKPKNAARAVPSGKAPRPAAAAAAPTAPTDDQMRAGMIWYCAVQVAAVHFDIDANDPAGSLSKPLDWDNASSTQAPVLALDINKEAPAIAAHDAASYALKWNEITPKDLTACPTVGDVVQAINDHYS